jgi:hypothetical protein
VGRQGWSGAVRLSRDDSSDNGPLLRNQFSVALPQRIITFLFISLLAVEPSAGENLEETIAYLLDYVAHSNATFIRNGTTHTPAEAVAHIKAKYEHFKSRIDSPEDFIRLSASKSLVSGKPYLVRMPDGKELHLDAWLTEALQKHRAGAQ